MRIFIAAAAALIVSNSAQADAAKCAFLPDKEFATCLAKELAATEAVAEKAAAADAAAKPKPAAAKPAAKPAPTSPGKWRIYRETSQVDDSQIIVISLRSDTLVTDEDTPWRSGIAPRLAIQCIENHTSVLLDWEYFWFYNEHSVTTRIDKAKAQTRDWHVSTDNVKIFHDNPIDFTRALAEGDKLVVRTAPISEPHYEVTFDLRGLRYHLPELQKACHWN